MGGQVVPAEASAPPALGREHLGDELVERLIGYGIRRVFGCPGGQTLPLYNAIAKRGDRIEHVLMRDERSAGFAADAYARATGTVGCCDATVGPGATNLVSALAEAYTSSIPLLAIVSDVRREWAHHRRFGAASQAFDQRGLLEGAAKWYGRVEHAESLGTTLHACLRIATAGRPGPVVLEIPDDVFAGPSSTLAMDGVAPAWARYPRLRPGADPAAAGEAAELLAGCQRPLIVAGGGVLIADATDELLALAETLGALVTTTMSGKGAIVEDHPRSVGVGGRFGVPLANEVMAAADGVVFVGSKVGQTTTLNWTLPSPGSAVVEIDVDPEELGRSGDSIAILADAKLGMAALERALRDRVGQAGWDLDRIAAARRRWWEGPIDFRQEPVAGVLKPQEVVRTIAAKTTDDDLLVPDASLASGWGATRWPVLRSGRRFIAPRGLAGLGWGLPAAIGAAAALADSARPGRVFCLAGDGGWAYSLAETETAARHGLQVIAVILNNSTLGWIKHTAEDRYPDGIVSRDFIDVRFAAAASALGAVGEEVQSLDELSAALDRAIERQGPSVIEARSCGIETPVVSTVESGTY